MTKGGESHERQEGQGQEVLSRRQMLKVSAGSVAAVGERLWCLVLLRRIA